MNLIINLNKIEELDEALEVSNLVFKPSPVEVEKYHNRNDWVEKIKNNGLLITAKNNNLMVGFSICYPKDGKFHIWNVGVLENYRKLGVWKQMYDAVLKFAIEKGFKHLTLNTYKDKFSNMYAFCLNQGFVEYKTEEGKSYLVKDIS